MKEVFGKEIFDMILCRNVLIYFPFETQNIIVNNLTSALKVGGYLVIGKTEWLEGFGLKYKYKPVDLINRIFIKVL